MQHFLRLSSLKHVLTFFSWVSLLTSVPACWYSFLLMVDQYMKRPVLEFCTRFYLKHQRYKTRATWKPITFITIKILKLMQLFISSTHVAYTPWMRKKLTQNTLRLKMNVIKWLNSYSLIPFRFYYGKDAYAHIYSALGRSEHPQTNKHTRPIRRAILARYHNNTKIPGYNPKLASSHGRLFSGTQACRLIYENKGK